MKRKESVKLISSIICLLIENLELVKDTRFRLIHSKKISSPEKVYTIQMSIPFKTKNYTKSLSSNQHTPHKYDKYGLNDFRTNESFSKQIAISSKNEIT